VKEENIAMGSANGNLSRRQSSSSTLITPDQGGYMSGRGERWAEKASNYYNINLVHKAHWS